MLTYDVLAKVREVRHRGLQQEQSCEVYDEMLSMLSFQSWMEEGILVECRYDNV